MRNVFCFFMLFVFFQLSAQDHTSCDGMRYRADLFDNVECTKALKFGEGITIDGNFKELFLDIYEPADDNAEARPAIILAFGGSYIVGNREDLDWLCRAYAKKGFVAVTIDYRLFDGILVPLPTAEQMQDVVSKSVSDMKAAIRFLKEDADTENLYKIDPDYIFLGGISAGSITATHTAMLDSTDTFTPELWSTILSNGGIEGNSSDNLQYSTDVRGLVNFSGGLSDASWIDAEDPPFVSVHDEFDDTVPYSSGFASIFGFDIIYMEGSFLLKENADMVGVQNQLHTIEGSNVHVSYFGSQQSTIDIINLTAEFLYDIICGEFVAVSAQPSADDLLSSVEVYPNPTDGSIFLKQDNAIVLELTVSNIFGQRLAHWENADQADLSVFENGIYLLEIANEASNQRIVKRIVLEK